MAPGRAGAPPTGQPGRFVDPFETVLMPTARRMGTSPSASEAGAPMTDTQVMRPDQTGAAEGQGRAINPIVGLLVVTGGPGKGSSRPLYYGNNSIGRDASQIVCLDFGDVNISAQEQAFIRYDYEDRKFLFIPNLSKTNVVSVNADKPAVPVELKPWDEIKMGHTKLRFLPVCGTHFDWSDIVDQ